MNNGWRTVTLTLVGIFSSQLVAQAQLVSGPQGNGTNRELTRLSERLEALEKEILRFHKLAAELSGQMTQIKRALEVGPIADATAESPSGRLRQSEAPSAPNVNSQPLPPAALAQSPTTKEAKKQAQRKAEVFANAAIAGCAEGTVSVDPRATGNRSFASFVKVRVLNLHTQPIEISDTSGVVVKGLCSGGSITLFRSYRVFMDPQYLSFQYIATGRFADSGETRVQQSPTYSLSGNQGATVQNYVWEVRLYK